MKLGMLGRREVREDTEVEKRREDAEAEKGREDAEDEKETEVEERSGTHDLQLQKLIQVLTLVSAIKSARAQEEQEGEGIGWILHFMGFFLVILVSAQVLATWISGRLLAVQEERDINVERSPRPKSAASTSTRRRRTMQRAASNGSFQPQVSGSDSGASMASIDIEELAERVRRRLAEGEQQNVQGGRLASSSTGVASSSQQMPSITPFGERYHFWRHCRGLRNASRICEASCCILCRQPARNLERYLQCGHMGPAANCILIMQDA